MDKSKYGVHRTHCCIKHGCKYGDKDCPVVSGEIKQDYTCESCGYDGIKTVDELFKSLNKICKIINSQFSYILEVDEMKISFQGGHNADYFEEHYSELGFKVERIDDYIKE